MNERPEYRIDFLESYGDKDIVNELRRISQITGKSTVTKSDLARHGRMSYSVVNKRFGSLRKALQEAGLQPQRFMKATEEELLDAVLAVWETTLRNEGRRPYRRDLDQSDFSISSDTIVRRFGSWKAAMIKAFELASLEDNASAPNDTEFEAAVGPKKRKALSLRKRFFVLKRDEFTCQICGRSGQGIELEVDHKTPASKGGSDALENLWTLCFDCNRGKRDSHLSS